MTMSMVLVNDVLFLFIYSFFIIYFDDMLVYNATWEEYISYLKQVLETLKKHRLLLNREKCEFLKESLVYMGYVQGRRELNIDPT